jgi:hypothetical protein
VVIDECGCVGGCAVEWLNPDDPRLEQEPMIRRKRKTSRFIEWLSADDVPMLYLAGPDFVWV